MVVRGFSSIGPRVLVLGVLGQNLPVAGVDDHFGLCGGGDHVDGIDDVAVLVVVELDARLRCRRARRVLRR